MSIIPLVFKLYDERRIRFIGKSSIHFGKRQAARLSLTPVSMFAANRSYVLLKTVTGALCEPRWITLYWKPAFWTKRSNLGLNKVTIGGRNSSSIDGYRNRNRVGRWNKRSNPGSQRSEFDPCTTKSA